MRGLCHNCLTSGVEILIEKGQIICLKCLEKKNAKN